MTSLRQCSPVSDTTGSRALRSSTRLSNFWCLVLLPQQGCVAHSRLSALDLEWTTVGDTPILPRKMQIRFASCLSLVCASAVGGPSIKYVTLEGAGGPRRCDSLWQRAQEHVTSQLIIFLITHIKPEI